MNLINQRDKQLWSPLYFALANDWYEVTEMLLSHGATTTFRDSKGRTVLHYVFILD